MPVEYEPIAGRYATLELDGRPCRLFFEEAGQGFRSSACTPPAPTAASTGT